MKQWLMKVAAVLVAFIIMLSVFALPVSAVEVPPVDWWDVVWLDKLTGKTIWTAFWEATDEMMWDAYVRQQEWFEQYDGTIGPSNNPWSYEGSEDGKSNPLLQHREYWVGASGSGSASGGRGGSVSSPTASSGGRSGTASAYASGEQASMSLISQTYNSTTNNYSYMFNMPTYNYNQTTNNYYNQYDITNIYYNQTYNTYNIQTTNNYNYYITYSPTYVNITYLDSGSGSGGSLANYTYFFQLPDGRNSWDLTADEVFGMYFIYNATNYDMVIEDEKTLALYHFDGSIKDESSYKGTASYLTGASYTYVDHGAFDRALYWDGGGHALKFDVGSSLAGSTLEFMLYVTASQPMVPFAHVTSNESYSSRVREVVDASYFFPSGYVLDVEFGTWAKVEETNTLMRGVRTDTLDFEVVVGSLISIGDASIVPIIFRGTAKVDHEYSDIAVPSQNQICGIAHGSSGHVAGPACYQTVYKYRSTTLASRVSQLSGEFVVGSADDAAEIPVGSWSYIALSGGNLYLNGLKVADIDASGSGSTFTIAKPKEWNNYWYLDEVRLSSGALYSGNYTPQYHPYDTNKVMVLPDTGNNGDIAIKSNIPVRSFRVGGARPTYPITGDVYVAVTKTGTQHKVESVQQYQNGGWVNVDASIRAGDEWKTMKSYDLKSFTVEDDGSGGGGGGPGDGGGDDGGGDDGGSGFWDLIGDALSKLFQGLIGILGDVIGGIINGLVDLVLKLVDALATLITKLFDALFGLVDFATRFGDFIKEVFYFIPPEITAVIVVALSLGVIMMIINFFR